MQPNTDLNRSRGRSEITIRTVRRLQACPNRSDCAAVREAATAVTLAQGARVSVGCAFVAELPRTADNHALVCSPPDIRHKPDGF
jgi:hypothetical protein